MIQGIDPVEGFGHPWHGVARGGTLTLPNTETIALPGAVAVGGDCIIIDAGAPPNSLPATNGMTWPNYAVMSGLDHRLYGQALGDKRWIYVASDGSRWLAEITIGYSSSTLALKQFGVIGSDDLAVTQTLYLDGVGSMFAFGYRVTDCSRRGSNAYIGDRMRADFSTVDPFNFSITPAIEGVIVGITGIPPSAEASISQPGLDALTTASGGTGLNSWHSREVFLGYTFGELEAPVLVFWRELRWNEPGHSDSYTLVFDTTEIVVSGPSQVMRTVSAVGLTNNIFLMDIDTYPVRTYRLLGIGLDQTVTVAGNYGTPVGTWLPFYASFNSKSGDVVVDSTPVCIV